jgi:putative peptidoglycan lipid II flippase
MGVVTQLNNRFVLYAVSPIIYNLGIIIGIVALYPTLGLVGLVVGVVLGALGHILVQLPFVYRNHINIRVVRRFNMSQLWHIVRVALPRALTLSLNQVTFLFLVSIATTYAVGSVAMFQLAYNIQSVPLAIIGTSYSVAAFPTLSRLFAERDHARFNRQIITAMRHVIFWSVPVIGLVVVLRAHIVRVLLGSGEFDWTDTRVTAAILAIFVVSLFAQALLLLLIRALYAGGKTKLPLYVTLGASAVTVISAVSLHTLWRTSDSFNSLLLTMFRLDPSFQAEVLILAMAFALGQFVQLLGMLVLSYYFFTIPFGQVRSLVWRSLFAMIVGSGVAYAILNFVVDGVNQNTFMGIFLQGGVAGVFGLIGVFLTYRLVRTPELREITAALHFKAAKRRSNSG